MISRIIAPSLGKSRKSILLLGPRQTGKSTLIRSLRPDLAIDLSDQSTFLNHAQDFDLLKSLIERRKPKVIFIDEIQRLPELLNTIQFLIDSQPQLKFYLSGSSARKLKRGSANLLPGRVINYGLGPLILKELNYQIRLQDLIFGFLPGVYSEKNPEERMDLLSSYSANYVNEEIKAESLVRDLPAFSRFLELTPEIVGSFIDYSKMSKLTKISRHQIPRYFEIFEDTMVGYRIFPDPELLNTLDLIKHPKFYFFDVGVLNGLLQSYQSSKDRMGFLCEQVAFQQLIHSAASQRKPLKIHTLRTRGGSEIDFWCEWENKKMGIEIKATDNIIDDDVQHLVHFKKILPEAKYFLFHFGKTEIKKRGIWCLPLTTGLRELGF